MITPHDEPSLSLPLDTQSTPFYSHLMRRTHEWMLEISITFLHRQNISMQSCLVHPSIDIPFSFTRLLIFICSVFQLPFHTQLPSPFIAIRRLWREMMNGKWMWRKKGKCASGWLPFNLPFDSVGFKGLFGFQLAKGTERKIGLGNIAVKILFTVALLVCAQKVSSVCFHAQVLLIIWWCCRFLRHCIEITWIKVLIVGTFLGFPRFHLRCRLACLPDTRRWWFFEK